MGNIGMVLTALGDLDGAQDQIQRALKIADDIGDQEGIVIMHLNLGYIGLAKGDQTQARTELLLAMRLGWALALAPLALDALCGLSDLLSDINPDRARQVMAAVLCHPALNGEIENNAQETQEKHPDVFDGLPKLTVDEAEAAVKNLIQQVETWLA